MTAAHSWYLVIAGYGIYADSPEAVFLGKVLGADRPEPEEDAWAS